MEFVCHLKSRVYDQRRNFDYLVLGWVKPCGFQVQNGKGLG